MKSFEEIRNKLIDLINQETGQSYINIGENCRLEFDLCIDSLCMASLQINVEDTFHFEFDPINDDFEACFYTFGSLCKYIANKCGEK